MITDIQGKLATLMQNHDTLIHKITQLIDSITILEIPVMLIEQYPEGIGKTVPEIASHLNGIKPLVKRTFSSLKEPHILERLREHRRTHIILSGIETHVCIYQSAHDLVRRGYTVHVPVETVLFEGGNRPQCRSQSYRP